MQSPRFEKIVDPEYYQKWSLRIAKCGSRELNNVIAETQEILMMIVEKCTCRELKNVDTKDYQKWSPTCAKCGVQELNIVIAEMYILRIEKCGH